MPEPLGYVVIEYDLSSGTPDMPLAAIIHVAREDAEFERDYARDLAAKAGRRERYVLAKVVSEESEDDRA